jgi:Phosphotransferase enzyme family
VLDDALLAGWCLRHLDAPLERVVFRSGHVSEVLGLELSDGLHVVVKARPFQPRITGCLRVQAELADAGFPCPRPLTAATRVRDLTVTAEMSMPGGEPLRSEDGGARFAALLARLIEGAPDLSSVPDLTPSPPWTGWDHPGRRLWPDIDEHGHDLNEATGPEWLDDAARRVRERLTRTPRRMRIGHGDWESQNIRWADGEPFVVHDWDSVIAQPETAIVGLAAAVWPREQRPDQLASVAQTADFIPATSTSLVGSGTSPRFEMRGRRASGFDSSMPNRRRLQAAVLSSIASPPRSMNGLTGLPSSSALCV